MTEPMQQSALHEVTDLPLHGRGVVLEECIGSMRVAEDALREHFAGRTGTDPGEALEHPDLVGHDHAARGDAADLEVVGQRSVAGLEVHEAHRALESGQTVGKLVPAP